MRYIIILVILISTNSFSEYSSDVKFKGMLKEAKHQIETDCFKCYKGSILEINSAIKKLETIIDNTKNEELLTLSLEALGDGYGEQAGYFNKKNKEKSIDLLTKRGEMYKKAYESNSCLRPNLLLKYFDASYIKPLDTKLDILKPMLGLQADFSQAKYYEGKILIEQGSIKAGLEALEVSVATALYVNAFYNGDDIAAILKKHGRNKMAKKILEKKK